MGSLFNERIVKFSTPKTAYYFGRYGGLSRNGSFGDIPGHGVSLIYRAFGLVDSEIQPCSFYKDEFYRS